LSGIEIRGLDDARRAARKIAVDTGVEAVVVKGGHMEGSESVDVLYCMNEYREYRAPRVSDPCNHGGGCSYSAAIAAELAKGRSIPEAVDLAKRFITTAISYGYRVGRGHCPVNPMAWLEIPAEKYRAIMDVEEALGRLLENSSRVAELVPEVGLNIARVIDPRYARSIEDVIGVEGRVVRYRGSLKPVGPVRPGASRHMARALLEAVKHDPEIRAAVNIAYREDIVEKAVRKGYRVVYVDRSREPPEVRSTEGASIPWIIKTAFESAGRVDIVYDKGDVGKEAMIRVFARSAVEAVEKILDILS